MLGSFFHLFLSLGFSFSSHLIVIVGERGGGRLIDHRGWRFLDSGGEGYQGRWVIKVQELRRCRGGFRVVISRRMWDPEVGQR